MSAPRLGHRRQGLLREPGPSRRLDQPLRSLSQLSPEDLGPAHGLGSPTPASVPPTDDLAKFQPLPLTPMPRLLDYETGAATRGNPAHGPAVQAKRTGHRSVSRGRRRDGRYGQKWTGSNGGSRRAEAAVKLSAGSRPLLGQQGSPLPRREDDAPVFRPSNGSHNGCPANHSSRRIDSAAGQTTPLASEADDASPPP
jgi:hypothetical protein